MFLGGTSWVYVSIHTFGGTPAALAVIMTGLFCGFLALVFSLPFVLYSRYLSKTKLGFIIGFAAIWTLGEWLRTWIFTGFPWLFIGYAHVDTFLSGWGPIIGVLGIGFTGIVSCNLILAGIFSKNKKHLTFALITSFLVWGAGFFLSSVKWTKINENPVSSVVIQPNIPLYKKWDPSYAPEIEGVLHELINQHWDKDLIILPENSIPYFYFQADPFLSDLNQSAINTQTNILAGILYDEYGYRFYNSIIGKGNASGIYHKQRLVPFGEYVPLENMLRGLINLFNLPTSIIQVGPLNPNGLSARSKQGDSFKIAPFICYEVVYPDLVAKYSQDAKLLVTISNDAWFGESIGPLQHYQMAQMRALENRKYMIRGTNTGLSGYIDPFGKSIHTGSQFVRETIEHEVYLAEGSTPYSITRSVPLTLSLFLFCLALAWRQHRRKL